MLLMPAVDALSNVSDHYSVTIDSGCLLTFIELEESSTV